MNKFRQYIDKSLMLWSTLERWQKLSILLAICGVLILLVFIIILGSSPSYVRLFSGLDTDDQSRIMDYLRENDIPYRLEPGIQAIFVPGNQVDELRLDLASAGLPKSGTLIDYSEIMKDSFGKTQPQINMIQLRALEGELARNLKQFDIVESARVNIVVNERELFKKDLNPSSAGVTLKLRPGYRITPQQVKAIVNLVAASVPRLTPERVTLVDTESNILTDMIKDDSIIYGPDGVITTIKRLHEQRLERELVEKAKNVLEKIYGSGKVAVEIAVDANFDQITETSIMYIPGPNGSVFVRSRHSLEEEYVGNNMDPARAPGTTTNIPGYSIETGSGSSEYSKADNTGNYELSSVETKKVRQNGEINRITASVVVDGEFEEQTLNIVKGVVSDAIGINESRGDSVSVVSMPFTTSILDMLREAEEREARKQLIIRGVIGLILLLIISVLAILWWKRRKAAMAVNKTLQESRHIPTIQEMLTSPEMIAAQGELSVLEEQIKAYARSNPKEVSSLVNEWLSED
ncbi:MAG: flagellar M-ring protein FliF [Synergistaceae bacterium]|nr:flagellar M-ring protein FliF [Synergistaceae bacterium]